MATVNFNDGIFVQEALQAFVATLAPLNAFSRDYSGETSAKGNAVYVPRVSAITATTFASSYTGGGGTINTITVNLNQHRIASASLTDAQMHNSSAAMLDNFAKQCGEGLAKLCLQDILSAVTTTNFGVALLTTAAANYTKTQVRAGRKALRDADVDTSVCSFVCDNDIYDALLGDTNIVQAFQYGGSEAIREGKIPRLLGLSMIESNCIPLNSISLAGFFTHPDAMAVACRYLEPADPGQYQGIAKATHENGLTIGLRRHYDPNTGIAYLNTEILFGYATALTTGLRLVTIP